MVRLPWAEGISDFGTGHFQLAEGISDFGTGCFQLAEGISDFGTGHCQLAGGSADFGTSHCQLAGAVPIWDQAIFKRLMGCEDLFGVAPHEGALFRCPCRGRISLGVGVRWLSPPANFRSPSGTEEAASEFNPVPFGTDLDDEPERRGPNDETRTTRRERRATGAVGDPPLSDAPAGAEFLWGSGSGGCHHRLISEVPPGRKKPHRSSIPCRSGPTWKTRPERRGPNDEPERRGPNDGARTMSPNDEVRTTRLER
ncbi:hypothetical protein Hsar01_01962 [Haloferula sargassicola]|uniref:Uncharacterized protein n=1 Tax=Haloferula sargassicola TaxID=490096 RepID=A0ABP9UN36_9BACT